MDDQGYVIVPGVLPEATCGPLLVHLRKRRKEILAGVAAGRLEEEQCLGPIKSREHRADLFLSLCPTVCAALRSILGELEPLLRHFLRPCDVRDAAGEYSDAPPLDVAQATLVELSSLHSLPGSEAQEKHSDTKAISPDHSTRCIVTCFVALQDIELEMGPTLLWPATHVSREHYCVEYATVEARSRGVASKPALLRKGDVLVMDSRLVHCGGANRSDTDRVLFYLSWKVPGSDSTGGGFAIRPDYEGKLLFGQWRGWTVPESAAESYAAK